MCGSQGAHTGGRITGGDSDAQSRNKLSKKAKSKTVSLPKNRSLLAGSLCGWVVARCEPPSAGCLGADTRGVWQWNDADFGWVISQHASGRQCRIMVPSGAPRKTFTDPESTMGLWRITSRPGVVNLMNSVVLLLTCKAMLWVFLLPLVLAAALLRTARSQRKEEQKLCKRVRECLSVFSDKDELETAPWGHGSYFYFLLVQRGPSSSSSSEPPFAWSPLLSLWFCVSSLLIAATRNAGGLHREAHSASLANFRGQRKCLLLLLILITK